MTRRVPLHILPPYSVRPRIVVQCAGALFLLTGAAALVLGVAMLLNPNLMGGAAASVWSAMCGRPAGEPSTSLLLAGVGAGIAWIGTFLLTASAARHAVAFGASLLIIGAGSGLGYGLGTVTRIADAPPPSGKFATLDSPRPMPNFILRNTSGGMTELRDFQGKATLLFFGYTHCPDVCPTTLSDLKRVKRTLGSAAGRVNFVFISVDGGRDTPEFLLRYVGVFDEGFVALTAHPSIVRAIVRDYGGDFREEPIPGTDTYKVLHTADSYLLDTDGRWRAVLPLGTPTEDMVREIRRALG